MSSAASHYRHPLQANPGIMRHRLKINAAIRDARAFLAVQREFGSFDAYVWRFVGSTICYAFMRAVGLVNDPPSIVFGMRGCCNAEEWLWRAER